MTASLLLLILWVVSSETFAYYISCPATAKVGDTVRVDFGDFPDRRKNCWIGIFDPDAPVTPFDPDTVDESEEPYTLTAPIKYIKCSDDEGKTFSTKGVGYKKFNIFNYRNNLIFRIFDSETTPRLLASSGILQVQNLEYPSQEHLALSGNLGEMVVTWNSISDTQYVEWGLQSGNLINSLQAQATTWTKYNMCGGVAKSVGWRAPGYTHSATITGLPSSTKVYYRVGRTSAWSNESFFISPWKGPTTSLRVAIIGDTGVQEADKSRYPSSTRPGALQTSLAFAPRANASDLVIHIGDMGYSEGYQAVWDAYMNSITNYAKFVPFMFVYGNHERGWPGTGLRSSSTDSGGDCGLGTSIRFRMPGVGSSLNAGWYSYQAGPVTFVNLNSEMKFTSGSDQIKWLETALRDANNNRAQAPWIVVVFHRPLYVTGGRVSTFSDAEPLLNQYKVNVVLSGHIHYYMRSCFVNNGRCITPSGGRYAAPVYVVSGTGGATFSSLGTLDSHVITAAKKYGFLDMQVTPTSLRIDYISDTGSQLDTVTLQKPLYT